MMATGTTVPNPDPLQQADPKAYYQHLFDSLGDAYWAASTMDAKDQIQAARESAFEILTAITQAQLDNDTSQLTALTGVVTKTNAALVKLQADIDSIVKKIAVAADVEKAIAEVLSLAGKLAV
jgi:hypothetical protein